MTGRHPTSATLASHECMSSRLKIAVAIHSQNPCSDLTLKFYSQRSEEFDPKSPSFYPHRYKDLW